jgi:uncharacterized DUF497 family protein
MTIIQWDPHKAFSNDKKHGVTFSESVSVLEDEYALTIEDDHPQERRFITLGMNDAGKLLVVVYTFQEDGIRLISARRATARERSEYEVGRL